MDKLQFSVGDITYKSSMFKHNLSFSSIPSTLSVSVLGRFLNLTKFNTCSNLTGMEDMTSLLESQALSTNTTNNMFLVTDYQKLTIKFPSLPEHFTTSCKHESSLNADCRSLSVATSLSNSGENFG